MFLYIIYKKNFVLLSSYSKRGTAAAITAVHAGNIRQLQKYLHLIYSACHIPFSLQICLPEAVSRSEPRQMQSGVSNSGLYKERNDLSHAQLSSALSAEDRGNVCPA